MKLIVPEKLKKGDLIGVVAPASPIIGDNIEEIQNAKKIIENLGYKVKFSENLFSNSQNYSASAKEKAKDINEMFKNSNIKMIWCAKGGENSNSTFEYLDFDMIKQNPKIICGYSDITSLTNIITQKTGLITYSSTNFKTVATDETDYSLKQVLKRFVDGDLQLGEEADYRIIQKGNVEGQLIGGNLSLTKALVAGKYNIDFTDKILFLEELGLETCPALANNYLYYMKQNGVFDKIKGLWIGNYEHQTTSAIEEVMSTKEFLTYADKYIGSSKVKGKCMGSKGMASAKRIIPARITKKQQTDIENYSKEVFRVLNLSGICRIDFMIDKTDKKVYVNEPNTIPGSLAFYLWEPIGKKYSKLLDEAITLAIKDYKATSKKVFSFESNILSNYNGCKGLKGLKGLKK